MKKKMLTLTALLLTVACTATACSNAKDPARAVSGLLQGLKSADSQAIAQYVDYNALVTQCESELVHAPGFLEAMFPSLAFNIIDTQQTDENTYIVTTEITNISIAAIYSDYMAKTTQMVLENAMKPTEEQMGYSEITASKHALFIEIIKTSAIPAITIKVEITATYLDGSFVIQPSVALANAVMGGLMDTPINQSVPAA